MSLSNFFVPFELVERARAALKDRWRNLNAGDGNKRPPLKLTSEEKLKSPEEKNEDFESKPISAHRRKKNRKGHYPSDFGEEDD